jgi:ribulose-bisphosphate carboxylase large chain
VARLHVTYRVRSDPLSIEERARAIAVEQSVEMPVEVVEDAYVRWEIIGRVETVKPEDPGFYEVQIALSADTVGNDAGQLINMLFGNTSIHDDVVLHDVDVPRELIDVFGGPRHGLDELRRRAGAPARALTCSALKPQGLPPKKLADLARRFAEGGIDFIKDDHGLADQAYSPFAARLEAIASALAIATRPRGRVTRYVPSLSGSLDDMRAQLTLARQFGIDSVLAAPMIMGFSNFSRLVRDNPDMAFMAHPTMAGAARISPVLLLGKLFRLLGADAVVFPNHGGRFGYTPDICRGIADAVLRERSGLRPGVPVPAGGMTRQRVPEMLEFYGANVMLLIGGGLLAARERLTEETAKFVAAVENYRHE